MIWVRWITMRVIIFWVLNEAAIHDTQTAVAFCLAFMIVDLARTVDDRDDQDRQ